MKLKRLIGYFARVQTEKPDETAIRFAIGKQYLIVKSTDFDVAANTWTVRLDKADG